MGMAGYTVALMMIGVIISPCLYGKEFSDHQEIESEDGDIIDCVPLHSQPAFDHPLLKNHTIQMRPTFIPESTSTYTEKKINVTQAWNKNGRCPENTVPIRRIKREDILRSKSIENFGKKMTTPGIYAVMNSVNGLYFGTQFSVNIWKPVVQVPGEFSLAQTWLVSGDRAHLNTIEAGLQADGYQNTGCYNTDCPGFVQKSRLITVGGTYTTVSEYNGNQYVLPMLIWKDNGNWWLRIGEELVGYWPGELFNSIGSGATIVQWGGEIVNLETDGQHTTTDMGSGHFAEEGFRKASYFRSLMTVDGTNTLREPQGVYPIITNDNCYNIKAGQAGTTWGVNFFYDGDIIDCVPLHSQPAFDHPLLKNHTIQMRPTFIPESTSTYTEKKINVTQAWNKNGRCPENTVPIRRIKREDILRSKSIENFGKKMMTPGIVLYGSSSFLDDDPSIGHEYAVMNSVNGLYFGSQFSVNIWKPVVQVPGEFSLAQTWLSSGDRAHLNTIEAGLQVYPGKYGDNNVRLFVYWTADGYQNTGCYNTDCSGFVQRSSLITVGGSYTTVSVYNGNQYELPMLIWKDSGNWWLRIGEELVGYWPGQLFNSIGSGATLVQWGGEIVNLETGGQHTTTDMGSGHFAEEGFGKASYFRSLMTVDGTNTLREPQGVYPRLVMIPVTTLRQDKPELPGG
ncbi:hypothetical protein Bca52824_008880 [Brassica carinata]|uniref:Neprosin PEP catalytic domain-containing protein n=1 Tax=Brassica carinata TaxID=52824 RepID=A0A8X8B992_BRACI|nr:hypothetical protein Bca52824_008880 [Brassica carinata]